MLCSSSELGVSIDLGKAAGRYYLQADTVRRGACVFFHFMYYNLVVFI